MTKRQKGKHMKRLRAWHHQRNQDRKWARAMRELGRAELKARRIEGGL